MTESDTSTVDVDLGGVEAEDLLGGADDDREGLVDLVERDVLGQEPGVLESERNGDGGSDREVDGRDGGIGEA